MVSWRATQTQMQVAEIQERLTQARSALAPWMDERQTIAGARDVAATELKLLTEEAGADQKRLDAVNEQLASTADSMAANSEQVEELRAQVQQQRRDEAAAAQETSQGKAALLAAEARVCEARTAWGQLRNNAENERARSAALRALMEGQASGELKVSLCMVHTETPGTIAAMSCGTTW